jgi:hypothetical protein
MKRSVFAVILILSALFCAFAQSSSPIDLILLLDTSSGMASSYDTVSDYVTGSFLSEFLRIGDTFHLITFSGDPRLDIARRVESRGDVETIIGRMLIQYPVEAGNNVTAAISYAEDYAASLPSRPKKIVIVSTGGPDTNSLIGAARQRLSSRNISLDFVSVSSGQPLANLPSSGRAPVAAAAASSIQRPAATATQSTAQSAQTPPSSSASPPAASPTSATPAPQTTSPPAPEPTPPAASQTPSSTEPSQTPPAAVSTQTPPSAEPSRAQTEPAQTSPPSPEPQTAPQQSAGTSGASSEASSTGQTPSSQSGEAAGTSTVQPQEAPVTPPPRGAQGDNNQAAASTPRAETTRSGTGIFSSSLPLLIGIIILALLILGLIIFFVSRRLGSSPNRVMASVSASKPQKREKEEQPSAAHSRELASYAAGQNKQRTTPYADRSGKTENVASPVINPSGPLFLNLFVEDQNTAIGKRNIHSLKSGYGLTVGGGKSDFLIFLVPVPPNIGEIRRNGSQCTFIPHKPKYFPDLGSNELRDCINKTIHIVSDKNYQRRFRFEMYEDPLEALNKRLHSVKVPG